MSIESVMPSNHLILCCLLLLLLSIFPSIRVFSNESALHIRWPKYWSFSFNISPSSEHPGLISFRMDWLDLLSVHGTLKSLLQCHNSQTSTWKKKREWTHSGQTVNPSTIHSGDFPGGPVAETLQLLMLGARVQFLVRELDPTCCN